LKFKFGHSRQNWQHRRLVLAWVLRRPEVASTITGASRPEQVHANAAASGTELSEKRAHYGIPASGSLLSQD
jgi:aryl-alcohol dehydrogenase-like predicted oxidoreductase